MARYVDVEGKTFPTSHRKILNDFINGWNTCLKSVLQQPTADVIEIPKSGIGDLSDGYHTFNELYHYRAVLFSVICNSMPDKAWKSKLHDTGDMFDGMFIVGIETPSEQATYHYDIEPYWDMFKIKELEKAPKWDGHTPAIKRIADISADAVEVRHEKWKEMAEYESMVALKNCFLYVRYVEELNIKKNHIVIAVRRWIKEKKKI